MACSAPVPGRSIADRPLSACRLAEPPLTDARAALLLSMEPKWIFLPPFAPPTALFVVETILWEPSQAAATPLQAVDDRRKPDPDGKLLEGAGPSSAQAVNYLVQSWALTRPATF